MKRTYHPELMVFYDLIEKGRCNYIDFYYDSSNAQNKSVIDSINFHKSQI